MSNASDYLETKLRDHMFRGIPFTAPSPIYIALFTGAPSDSGGGTEVTGGSYARVAITPGTSTFSAPSSTSGLTDNVSAITFPTATASWGTITHFATFDASSGGNLLVWGALTASVVVGSGQTFSFAAGALDITFA